MIIIMVMMVDDDGDAAHFHFFALNDLSYGWLSGPNQIPSHPFLHEKLNAIRHPYYFHHLMHDVQGHHVVKFVHLQCECDDALAEARYLQKVHEEHPEIAAQVPHANLSAPNVEEHLALLASIPSVRGIRQLLNWHPTDSSLRDTVVEHAVEDETWLKKYALLERYDLHYEFQGFATQMPSAKKLAARYPSIPMVINHTGLLIDFSPEGRKHWEAVMADLATQPNVFVKLSGLAMISHDWTQDSINSMIRYCIQHFGVSRVMYASNFPIEKAVVDYTTWCTAFKRAIAYLNAEEQKQVMHDNAIRFYRLF